MDFTVELAGVPMRIECRHAASRAFLADYITDRAPVLTIAPAREDLDLVAGYFDRMAARQGRPAGGHDGALLERNAIHVLAARALAAHGALVMHGSALCMDGQAVIFTASSGTGKSTHARLWREVFGDRVWMINDDKPILRVQEAGIRVYGSPWDGKHRLSRNASAPLRAIVRIARGAENRIEPLSRADACQMLLKHAFLPGDEETLRRVMAMERALIEGVRCYGMRCNRTRQAALTAYNGIFGAE